MGNSLPIIREEGHSNSWVVFYLPLMALYLQLQTHFNEPVSITLFSLERVIGRMLPPRISSDSAGYLSTHEIPHVPSMLPAYYLRKLPIFWPPRDISFSEEFFSGGVQKNYYKINTYFYKVFYQKILYFSSTGLVQRGEYSYTTTYIYLSLLLWEKHFLESLY